MSGADRRDFWRRVRAQDHAVPAEERLDDLTTELVTMLASPDPVQRDEVGFTTLVTWIRRGVYDELLVGLGDGLAVGLTRSLGETGTDTVFRRSFSAAALAACLSRGNDQDLLARETVLDWGDRVLSWLVRERDVRGFVPDRGWAHAVAHGADAVGELAGSRHLDGHELQVLLHTLVDRVQQPGPVWQHGETDRLAAAAMAVLHRGLVPVEELEEWVARIAAGGDPYAEGPAVDPSVDPFLVTGNAQQLLRSLHLQVSLSPRRPPHRADLLLALAAAQRATNAPFLAPPTDPTDQ